MTHIRRDLASIVAERRQEWTPFLPPAWYRDALCAQVDPELFFPELGGSTREAKRVCAGCPVRSLCLESALDRGERYGIWGGKSERERRKLKRERAAA